MLGPLKAGANAWGTAAFGSVCLCGAGFAKFLRAQVLRAYSPQSIGAGDQAPPAVVGEQPHPQSHR